MTQRYYVYAITGPGKQASSMDPITAPPIGAGAGPAEIFPINGLNVVVSTFGDGEILPVRRNTIGHTKVLEALMARRLTVLPMRFGVIVEDLATIERILRSEKSELVTLIAGMEGKIEVGITVRFNRDALFNQIANERPQYGARGRGFIGKNEVTTYHGRVALGQDVEHLIREKNHADRQEILDRIAPLCLENKELKIQDDMTVLRTACLVEAAVEPKLYEAIETFSKSRPEICDISYLAPVPPYNFVRANLDWGRAASQDH